MTPHLNSLPKDYKTQSYTLDGKELVSIPPNNSSTTLVTTKNTQNENTPKEK